MATTKFKARRVRLETGERFSVLHRPGALPVHEAVLFLAKFRRRGRAANTIHGVSTALALLHRQLAAANIDLLERLRNGQFLSEPEISRLADAAQYRADDLTDDTPVGATRPTVININSVRRRRRARVVEVKAVEAAHQANRIRYWADYLGFLAEYYGAQLQQPQKSALALESARILKSLLAQVPKVSRREKVGAREGLSMEDQLRVLAIVHPDSPENPWKRGYVRMRNWVIVVLLLATGMRRGELLGLQISDIDARLAELSVLRRADVPEDTRRIQANTKTNDRKLELRPEIMAAVWRYIQTYRRAIKSARKHPLLIVADDGEPLSFSAIDKIFAELRAACPGLSGRLTSHVMRHTWNERFSEQADEMKLSDTQEERARNEQQGWADNSSSATTYTRRHTRAKGRAIALKLQEKINVPGN